MLAMDWVTKDLNHLRKRARRLRAYSKSCATFLPSRGSLVAQVLCIEVLHAHVMEEEVSVKMLFAATGFSVSGCRAQFAWLVENGFLITAQAENDRRRQVVIPTPKLKDKFQLLMQAMERI